MSISTPYQKKKTGPFPAGAGAKAPWPPPLDPPLLSARPWFLTFASLYGTGPSNTVNGNVRGRPLMIWSIWGGGGKLEKENFLSPRLPPWNFFSQRRAIKKNFFSYRRAKKILPWRRGIKFFFLDILRARPQMINGRSLRDWSLFMRLGAGRQMTFPATASVKFFFPEKGYQKFFSFL